MNRKQLLFVGYATAAAGFVVYLVTDHTSGMMFGGVFLVLTSICKIIGDRWDQDKKSKKEEKKKR